MSDDYKYNIESVCLILKIIANIKVGDKLYLVDDKDLRIDNRYFISFRRYYNKDNRYKMIVFIEDKLSYLDTEINKLLAKKPDCLSELSILSQDDSEICQDIILNLESCKTGFDNLKTTYTDDVSFVSRLDMVIRNVQTKLNKLKAILIIKQ